MPFLLHHFSVDYTTPSKGWWGDGGNLGGTAPPIRIAISDLQISCVFFVGFMSGLG